MRTRWVVTIALASLALRVRGVPGPDTPQHQEPAHSVRRNLVVRLREVQERARRAQGRVGLRRRVDVGGDRR